MERRRVADLRLSASVVPARPVSSNTSSNFRGCLCKGFPIWKLGQAVMLVSSASPQDCVFSFMAKILCLSASKNCLHLGQHERCSRPAPFFTQLARIPYNFADCCLVSALAVLISNGLLGSSVSERSSDPKPSSTVTMYWVSCHNQSGPHRWICNQTIGLLASFDQSIAGLELEGEQCAWEGAAALFAAATAASVAFATRSKAAWKLFGSRAASFADKLAAANVQRNPNWNCLQELTPPLVKQPVYTK